MDKKDARASKKKDWGRDKWQNYLKIAINNIWRRKTRSILTFISITIGIAAVLVMVSVGLGLENTVNEQFEAMGVDKIFIMPGGGLGIWGIGGELDDEDLDVIRDARGVEKTGAMAYKVGSVEYRDERIYTWVMGVDMESLDLIEEAYNMEITEGRNLEEGDKFDAVVGLLIRNGEVFSEEVEIGKKIEIDGTEVTVVGGFEEIGNAEDDSSIMIPLEAAEEIFDIKGEYGAIMAKTAEGQDVSEVAENIKKDLRDAKNLEIGDEDFTVQTSEQLAESFGQILSILTVVVIGIASISLFVGGVGTMNVMYTAVLERTKEIGILKAVGAKENDILSIFMLESGILGMLGGFGGVILGIVLSQIISWAARAANYGMLAVEIRLSVCLAALAFSFAIGLISGYLPSKRASKLKPVDSLRYE